MQQEHYTDTVVLQAHPGLFHTPADCGGLQDIDAHLRRHLGSIRPGITSVIRLITMAAAAIGIPWPPGSRVVAWFTATRISRPDPEWKRTPIVALMNTFGSPVATLVRIGIMALRSAMLEQDAVFRTPSLARAVYARSPGCDPHPGTVLLRHRRVWGARPTITTASMTGGGARQTARFFQRGCWSSPAPETTRRYESRTAVPGRRHDVDQRADRQRHRAEDHDGAVRRGRRAHRPRPGPCRWPAPHLNQDGHHDGERGRAGRVAKMLGMASVREFQALCPSCRVNTCCTNIPQLLQNGLSSSQLEGT